MVRPTQEGTSRPIPDEESVDGTIAGDAGDGFDFPTGGSDVPSGSESGSADNTLEIIAASTSTLAIDFGTAPNWDITLTANCTVSITSPAIAGQFELYTLILRQGGSGNYGVTWPASVEWRAVDGTEGGAAPVLATSVGARDIVLLITEDGGTTYGGSFASNSSSSSSTATGGHTHVAEEIHLSDGSTTTYTLDAYYESGSIQAWNRTTIARLLVTEVLPDKATVSAAGSAGDQIIFDYAATLT